MAAAKDLQNHGDLKVAKRLTLLEGLAEGPPVMPDQVMLGLESQGFMALIAGLRSG